MPKSLATASVFEKRMRHGRDNRLKSQDSAKNYNFGRAAIHGLCLVPRVERTLKIGEWKRMTIQACLD